MKREERQTRKGTFSRWECLLVEGMGTNWQAELGAILLRPPKMQIAARDEWIEKTLAHMRLHVQGQKEEEDTTKQEAQNERQRGLDKIREEQVRSNLKEEREEEGLQCYVDNQVLSACMLGLSSCVDPATAASIERSLQLLDDLLGSGIRIVRGWADPVVLILRGLNGVADFLVWKGRDMNQRAWSVLLLPAAVHCAWRIWSDASLAGGRAGLGWWLEVRSSDGWSPAFFGWSVVQAGWQASILEFESRALEEAIRFFQKWLVGGQCLGISSGGLADFASVLKGMKDRKGDST